MTTWRKVDADEFYAAIGPRNCHPYIVPGSFPYASVFRTPSGDDVGKSVGRDDRSGLNDYYLPIDRHGATP